MPESNELEVREAAAKYEALDDREPDELENLIESAWEELGIKLEVIAGGDDLDPSFDLLRIAAGEPNRYPRPDVEQTSQTMQLIAQARDGLGIRLETANSLSIWEAQPRLRHQMAVNQIRANVRPLTSEGKGCECFVANEVLIRFPNGSLKTPDISIFCRKPEEEDRAITVTPDAVIEVISPRYEVKDLVIGPPFYLSQGVRDVIVFDPVSLKISHFRGDYMREYLSPMNITLECGCVCSI